MKPAHFMCLTILFAETLSGCAAFRNSTDRSGIRDSQGNSYEIRRMPDGKYWTTENIELDTLMSFCYDGLSENCLKYGRLYTWKAANAVCSQLGKSWMLPTKDDWKLLAENFGGVYIQGVSEGKNAYESLMQGGSAQFNAILSGARGDNGVFRRIDAHGFYWTASQINDSTAVFANFGKGRPALFLQDDGEKGNAFAVRCVRK